MSIAGSFLIAAGGGGTPGTVTTTGNFDSTGVTALMFFCKFEGGGPTTIAISDNKGNNTANIVATQSQVNHSGGEPHCQTFYWPITVKGANHQVTMTLGANRSHRIIEVSQATATSGVVALDATAGAFGTGVVADAGTLSTSGAQVFSIMGAAEWATSTWTPSTGWTETVDGFGGSNVFGALYPATASTPLDPAATQTVNDRWAAGGFSLREVTGGTTYTQSVGGTLATAGALSKVTNKGVAGTLATSGTVSKRANKAVAGALAMAGALSKRTNKALSGTLSTAGSVTTKTVFNQLVGGTLTLSGTLARALVAGTTVFVNKLRALGLGFGVSH